MVTASSGQFLEATDFSLDSTLRSGQSFSWRRLPDGKWEGWIGNAPVILTHEGQRVAWSGSPGGGRESVRRYLGLDHSLAEVRATFPQDTWLEQAQAYAPGLRILRQPEWETTVNFICSSLKQIPHIEQMNAALRRRFGREIEPGKYTFPTVQELQGATEVDLRECRLGFRARHLHRAVAQVASGEVSLERIGNVPTVEARAELLRLAGVGEKVANCILLFGFGRMEAFPIDVWVLRVLRELYFARKRKVTILRMKTFADDYFGPNAGYAQQYLFHWIRTGRRETAVEKKKAPRKTKKRGAAVNAVNAIEDCQDAHDSRNLTK